MNITEEQVKEILTVAHCVEILRDAFAREYINIPRYRLKSKRSLLQVMSASIPDLGVMGLKAYGTSAQSASFRVLLFDEQTGNSLTTIEADALGQIRTGAASGLATDLLANRNVEMGAIIGTGYQAETQLLAIDSVRSFREIRIHSRNPKNRKAFVEKMSSLVRSPLAEAETAEDCVRNADVICTITSSRDPVIHGAWLKPGCHINAAGSNSLSRRELDEEAVGRSDLIVCDSLEQSKIESGDLVAATVDWKNVYELRDVIKGKISRSAMEQITLFKSNGIAMEDIAAAHFVYKALKKRH